jgi:hypothetical protein
MLGIIASLVGVLGMLGLWALAWSVWRGANPPALERSIYRRAVWQNEPTPKPRPLVRPPTWVFEGGADEGAAPVARQHASSNADTCFFSREEIGGAVEEKTEILSEEDIIERDDEPPEPPEIARKPCKTQLYGGPR